MVENIPAAGRRSSTMLLLSVILAALLLVIGSQTLRAEEEVVLPPNLDGSSKAVSQATATPGSLLRYTIVISNSGTDFTVASLTDALPATLSYQAGSLSSSIPPIGMGESGGVITWTAAINPNSEATVTFDAVLTDTLKPGDVVTNTVVITGTNLVSGTAPIVRSAATTIYNVYESYLPVVHSPIPMVTLQPIGRPNNANSWTLFWTANYWNVTGYEVQEARTADFSDATTLTPGLVYQLTRTPSPSTKNIYYYRVRALTPNLTGPWSNVESVTGAYRDDFGDNTTGWKIRREDTDDINNSSRYENGNFILKIGGRWDYAIASSMAEIPAGGYRLSTSVRLEGPDNLNSYGLIFGGDWDGTTCPNSDFSSCFNHYYRLNVIWFGAVNTFRVEVKRIDYHDASNNAGRGVTLFMSDINVGNPDGWNEWWVEVRPTGDIKLFVNGNLVGTMNDSTYINDRYFGFFASTDEYLGSEPWFDWVEVRALD